jgi:hypothetical protein
MPISYTAQGWQSGTVTAPALATTRVLAFAPRVRLPRPWTVNVRAWLFGDGATVSRSTTLQHLQVTYTILGVTKVILVDLAAGGACFDIVADTITIDAINGEAVAQLFVSAAITRYVEGVPWRNPTRTVIGPVSGAGGFIIDVPLQAKSFQWHNRNASLPGIFLDGAGTQLGTFGLIVTSSIMPSYIQIPVGTRQLQSVGANGVLIVFVFEIGA